jgi:hypothetical protein
MEGWRDGDREMDGGWVKKDEAQQENKKMRRRGGERDEGGGMTFLIF